MCLAGAVSAAMKFEQRRIMQFSIENEDINIIACYVKKHLYQRALD